MEGVQCVEEEREDEEDHRVYQGPQRKPFHREPGQCSCISLLSRKVLKLKKFWYYFLKTGHFLILSHLNIFKHSHINVHIIVSFATFQISVSVRNIVYESRLWCYIGDQAFRHHVILNIFEYCLLKCLKYDSLGLFFQSLRPALLNVREMCHRISDMGLCKVEKGNTYALSQFREAQFTQLTEVGSQVKCQMSRSNAKRWMVNS